MLTPFRSVLLSKKALAFYIIEILLLITSAYNFGQQGHNLYDPEVGLRLRPLVYIIVGGFFPLIIFVFIAVREALTMVQLWSSASFQHRLDELQKRMNMQDDFFQAINNNATATLTLYDHNHAYWFLNASAAREIGFTQEEVIGKTPSEVLGPERGRKIIKNLDKVRQDGQLYISFDHHTDTSGNPHYVQTSYRPLAPFGEFTGGVIAYGENVTTIIIEREKREATLRQVISTLVAVVDRRDPYAAGHSAHVGQLSRSMALEMRLSEKEVEASEIAGSLMNFGKVLVSRAILTKTESLSPEELQRIRDGILTSADILSMIDFNVPVVPILRQVLERYDGEGVPQGIKGDSILITARIVAVANAFVALVSPRAYRPGLHYPLALQSLSQDSGKAYDPKVIAVLSKVLETSASKIEWLAGKNS